VRIVTPRLLATLGRMVSGMTWHVKATEIICVRKRRDGFDDDGPNRRRGLWCKDASVPNDASGWPNELIPGRFLDAFGVLSIIYPVVDLQPSSFISGLKGPVVIDEWAARHAIARVIKQHADALAGRMMIMTLWLSLKAR